MEKSKLMSLVNSLSDKELEALDRFLHSPFHNQHKDVQRLFRYIKKQKERSKPDFSREAAFRALFKGGKFKDAKIRHVMSYLVRCVQDFLVIQEFQRDPVEGRLRLVEAYRNRNLFKQFQAELRQLEKSSSPEMQGLGPWRHLNRYRLGQVRFSAMVDRMEGVQETLQEVSNELDAFFVVSKLRLACTMVAHRSTFNVDYRMGFLSEVLVHAKKSGLLDLPVVRIYYCAFQMLSGRDPGRNFGELIRLMDELGEKMESGEMQALSIYAINFCIRQINLGVEEYVREVFQLYQKALLNGALLSDGMLSPWTYKNICSAGLKLEEFDWVSEFNYKWRDAMPEEYQRPFYYQNEGRLFLAKGEFRKCIRTLDKVETKDLLTLLGVRVMEVKARYELQEYDLIEYRLENFRQLLQRRGIRSYHKTNYQNFVRLAQALIRLSPGDARARLRLRREIQSAEILTERDWLLKKLDQ